MNPYKMATPHERRNVYPGLGKGHNWLKENNF